jgi:hypothetical protein
MDGKQDDVFLPGLTEAIGKAIKKWGREHRLTGMRPGETQVFLTQVVRTLQTQAAFLAFHLERDTADKTPRVAMTEEEFLRLAREAWARRGAGQ